MTRGRLRHARRAVAAVEFALVSPLLLAVIGGLADFGLSLADQGRLASAVAQAAQYAYLNPTTVTQSTIQSIVVATASLSGMTTSNVKVKGPSFLCVNSTTTPPTAVAATASTTCSDGTKAGSYVGISATYAYPALMPGYSQMVDTTLTEKLTARIQ